MNAAISQYSCKVLPWLPFSLQNLVYLLIIKTKAVFVLVYLLKETSKASKLSQVVFYSLRLERCLDIILWLNLEIFHQHGKAWQGKQDKQGIWKTSAFVKGFDTKGHLWQIFLKHCLVSLAVNQQKMVEKGVVFHQNSL